MEVPAAEVGMPQTIQIVSRVTWRLTATDPYSAISLFPSAEVEKILLSNFDSNV
jgi:hypothetical protein